jgi:hypothetical protein
MAVAVSNLAASSDTTNQQNYSIGSLTYTSGRLYLIAIYHTDNVDNTTVGTLSGASQTFDSVATIRVDTTAGATQRLRLTLFRCLPTSTTSGALTYDAGRAVTGALWSVNEVTGMDTGGTNGSAAIVQNITGQTPTTDTSLTLTLSAFGDAANGAFSCWLEGANDAMTPDTGWTELSDTTMATPGARLETQWRADNDTSPAVSFSGGAQKLAGIAVEIKVSGAAPAAITRRDLTLLGVGA